jgi:hypothetical protein
MGRPRSRPPPLQFDDGAFTVPIELLEIGDVVFPDIAYVSAQRARVAYAQLDADRWVILTGTTGTSGWVFVE